MRKEFVNKHIGRLSDDEAQKYEKTGLYIDGCVIDDISLLACVFEKPVEIRNCVIRNINIYNAWFKEGLTFDGNVVLGTIDYQTGGHNRKPYVMTNNIFKEEVRFFDCIFEAEVRIIGNIFEKGTDILTKENPGFDNRFEHGIVTENNIGKLDIW